MSFLLGIVVGVVLGICVTVKITLAGLPPRALRMLIDRFKRELEQKEEMECLN